MKIRMLFCASVVSLASVFTSRAPAVPVEASNSSREYLIAAKDLSDWSCGTYMAVRQRDVNTPWHPYRVEMVTEELMGYLGYDLARWVTAYMAAGVAQNALALGGGAPMAGAYGVGMHFNVLDHEIMDPTLFEDRLRVNGGWQATYTQSEWKGHEFEMFDFYAALLGSVVNDLDGSKYFVPRSIAIYAGPIYADALGTAIRNRTRFGAAAGLEFHWSPHFAWHIGMNTLNGDLSPESGVYIRF